VTNLLIASKDADAYSTLIEQANLPDLNIWKYPQPYLSSGHEQNIDIIFGDPNLCVEALEICPNVKWVQSTWAGIKPLLSRSRQDFILTGVKDVFGPQMREYVFAYLLYFSRQIQNFQNLQKKTTWTQLEPTSLNHKTMGILGLGSIGSEVAKTAKHFGMKVIGIAQNQRNETFIDEFYRFEQYQTFARKLDYLVVLLPHTENTERIIDKQFLAFLKPDCILINAGRGQVIDEQDLADALKHNQLKAAVLDVFQQEPLPESHPFWKLDNLFITQHTAAISQPSEICKIFLRNFSRFQQGKDLQYRIDWAKGY